MFWNFLRTQIEQQLLHFLIFPLWQLSGETSSQYSLKKWVTSKKRHTYYGDTMSFDGVGDLHPSIGNLNGIETECLSRFVLVAVH